MGTSNYACKKCGGNIANWTVMKYLPDGTGPFHEWCFAEVEQILARPGHKYDIPFVGSVTDLVRKAAVSDARATFMDVRTGATIRINIDGLDGATEKDEPFYIESPDGENLYDAYNRKEAIRILSNIRKGNKYPDMPLITHPTGTNKSRISVTGKKIRKRQTGGPSGLGSTR